MKRFVSSLVALAIVVFGAVAWAGSYLDRAALLVTGARQTNEWVLGHLGDKELAMVAETIADARVKAARNMLVPKDVAPVHPHLLLMLENSERAAAAAADGDPEKFLHHLRTARDEEAAFKSLLSLQHLSLPDVSKR